MTFRKALARIFSVLGIAVALYILLNIALDRSAPDITVMTFVGFSVATIVALLAAWASVAILALLFGNSSDSKEDPSRLWLASAYISSAATGAGAFVGVLTLLGL